MTATVKTCPTCDQPAVAHCESRTCNWWRCTSCHSYGSETATHIDDRKRYGS